MNFEDDFLVSQFLYCTLTQLRSKTMNFEDDEGNDYKTFMVHGELYVLVNGIPYTYTQLLEEANTNLRVAIDAFKKCRNTASRDYLIKELEDTLNDVFGTDPHKVTLRNN